MPMDLASLVGTQGKPQAAQPEGKPQPMPAQTGGAQQGGGTIAQLMRTMPADGAKKTAGVVVAISAKLLDAVHAAYGPGTQEGSMIAKALGDLSPITKNVQTGDMESVLKSMIQLLPPGMRNLQPGSANEILQAITGGAAPAQASGGAPIPPGAAPQPGGGAGASPMPIKNAVQ